MTPREARAEHYAQFQDAVAALPDRTPDPPMERYAWEHDVTPEAGEPVTAWGTPVRCIDTDEYCPSCERDNREGHYDNCQLYPPRAAS